jgi:hypothetical protein
MTETQTLTETPPQALLAADHRDHRDHPERPEQPDRPRRRPGPPGRVIERLGALLRAQALLNGSPGDPYDPAFVEDDRGRLSGRRVR